MKEIQELTPNNNLRQIVDTINAFIENGNINTKTLTTLTKSHKEPIKVFTATHDAIITGDVYALEMAGIYSVTTTGAGRTKIIIKDGVTNDVIDYQMLDNSTQSKYYFLSEGDKLYIHSSPVMGQSIDIQVFVTETLFDIIGVLRDSVSSIQNNQVNTEELTKVYTETLNQVVDYLEEIKASRISITNGLNFPKLNDRLEYIDGQIRTLGGGPPVKLHNWLNVLDYGAKNDGTLPQEDLLNRLLTEYGDTQVIYMPKGQYNINNTVTIPKNATLICDGEILTRVYPDFLIKVVGSNAHVEIAKITGSITLSQIGILLENSEEILENTVIKIGSIRNVGIGIKLDTTGTYGTIQDCKIIFNKIDVLDIGISIDGGRFLGEVRQNQFHGGIITAGNEGIRTWHEQKSPLYIKGNMFQNISFASVSKLFNLHGISACIIQFSIRREAVTHTMTVNETCDNINFVSMDALDFTKFSITGTNMFLNYQAMPKV